MKKNICIILFMLIGQIVFSQQYTTQSFGSTKFESMTFVNPNCGFALVYNIPGNTNTVIAKTTNKGINWQFSDLFNGGMNAATSISFVNENTGFALYSYVFRKTTDGASSWTSSTINPFGENAGNSKIEFFNGSTGYGVARSYDESKSLKFYRTTNAGNVWGDPIYEQATISTRVYYITDIAIDKENPDIAAFTGYSTNGTNDAYFTFVTYDGGANFYREEAGNVGTYRFRHNSVQILKRPNGDRDIKVLRVKQFDANNRAIYCASTVGSTYSEYKIADFDALTDYQTGSGIYFTNPDKGYCVAQGRVYLTTNGGVNWSQDYSFGSSDNSAFQRLGVIGDVVYAGHKNGTVATRKINANLSTYRDNNISVNSSMHVKDNPNASSYTQYSTPSNAYLYGGNILFNASSIINPGLTDEAVFYKWSTGEFAANTIANVYSDGVFSANYKTKQYSTIPSAISNPNSTKAYKDKVINGVNLIHQVHESMGGIFYSKSTNNGATFQTEDVINRFYPNPNVSGNKNVSLDIIKDYTTTDPVTIRDNGSNHVKEKNVISAWEYYDGTNTQIKVANRVSNIMQTGYEWNFHGQNSLDYSYAKFASSSNYESKPKIFAAANNYTTLDDSRTFYIAVPHLEPSTNNGNKIVVSATYGNSSLNSTVDDGDITDFAVTAKYNAWLGYVLHFAYKKAGKIYYKKAEFGFDFSLGLYYRNASTPLEISASDANTARHTPDISLRNGLPIVTYQGILPMTRMYSIEEFSSSPGLPETHTVQFTQYPIMVTYLKPDLTGWSNPTAQPSSGTIVQSDPNIEGSTTGNGYILSFRKGNSGYYQYSNLQNYHCDPPAFLGTDAKLVRGSYSTPLGGALLTTLTSENSLYKLGKQDVAVTNVNSQVQDGVYGNIKGVINMNDIDYVFNMGPIFVATGPQVDIPLFGDALNEVTPISGIEFNEYLRSEPFTLNNGDTLILGATANYIAVDKQDFYPIKYTVNLMNANTQEVSRVLFSDTIHIEDEEMTEYYRGFVFSDLNPEDGNVYLQIMVEDVSNTDATYSYVGIYQGESEVQDRGERIDPTNGVFVDFGHGRNLSNVLTVKPTSYSLYQNFPNPFNPSTTIKYSVPNDGLVQIKIYDLSGKEVMNLVNENKVAGNYEVKFNGANLSSGIYFYRINAGEFVQTKRMVLVK